MKTSDLIFEAMDKSNIPPEHMEGYLRIFIASEYDRDPTVADRLKVWLDDVRRSVDESKL